MTQTARVLAALRAHRDRGVTQVDFLLPNVVDGGRPITRIAARVLELRNQGHTIIVDGERDSCVVYRLLRSDRDIPATPPPPVEEERLFAPPATNAIYGDAA